MQDNEVFYILLFHHRPSAFSQENLDFFKPLEVSLSITLERLLAFEKLENLKPQQREETQDTQNDDKLVYHFGEIIGNSKPMKKIYRQIKKVAPAEANVLIYGETGSGKELIAKSLHKMSSRSKKPFVKVNITTLTSNLFESELFGHEKGAFTGAISQKIGLFELANGGTIFLDEVGELSMDLQPKLLRVLQEGEFKRVGGTKTLKTDVWIITATNKNLQEMVYDDKFREDLYFRLNVFPITNIPLRERKEDIPLLVQHFITKYNNKFGKSFTKISREALQLLMSYDFPGNIRELENLIERAIILENGKELPAGDWIPKNSIKNNPTFVPQTLEDVQRTHIRQILDRTYWKVSGRGGAAEILGMNSKTLFSLMKRLGIERHVRV